MRNAIKISLLAFIIAGCTTDKEPENQGVDSAALQVSNLKSQIPESWNPRPASSTTAVKNSWQPLTPCEFFTIVTGAPELRSVAQLVTANPQQKGVPAVVTYAELADENGNSDWIVFAGGQLNENVNVSASVGLTVGQKVAFLKKSSGWSAQFSAFWAQGPEVLKVEDGSPVSELGALPFTSSTDVSNQTLDLQSTVQDLRASNNCQTAWRSNGTTHTARPARPSGEAPEVVHPQLDGENPPLPSTGSSE